MTHTQATHLEQLAKTCVLNEKVDAVHVLALGPVEGIDNVVSALQDGLLVGNGQEEMHWHVEGDEVTFVKHDCALGGLPPLEYFDDGIQDLADR